MPETFGDIDEIEMGDEEDRLIESANVMLGTFMQNMIDMAKAMPTVWEQMGEQDQDTWIQFCDARCRELIRNGVAILAAGNQELIPAVVEQVVFKDGVKVVLKINGNREGAHSIADAEGEIVGVIVANSEEYMGEDARPDSDKDQGELQV